MASASIEHVRHRLSFLRETISLSVTSISGVLIFGKPLHTEQIVLSTLSPGLSACLSGRRFDSS
jgi:hypothetical protein